MIFILLLFVAIGVLFGFLRGFKRSLVKLAASVFAAVLAFIIATSVSAWVGEEFLAPLLSELDLLGDLQSSSPTIAELIRTVPVALATPILFLLLYWILKILLVIPCFIINKVFKFKRKNETKTQKLLGLPIGAAQALISVLIFLFVFCGYLNIVDRVMETIATTESEEVVEDTAEDTMDAYEIMDAVTSDPIIDLFCGNESGNFVFDGLTKITVNGKKCSLTKESVAMVDAFVDIMPLFEGDGTNDAIDAQADALEGFTSKLCNSEILKSIATEVFASGGSKWANDEEFMGLSFAELDASVKPIMIEFSKVLSVTTPENIETDLNIFVQMLEIFNKYEIMSMPQNDDEAFMEVVNKGFARELINLFEPCERFAQVVKEIETLSVKKFATSLRDPEITEEQHAEVSNNIAEALNQIRVSSNPEENKELLVDEIYKAANENGVVLTEDVSSIISNAIDNALKDHEGEFTQEFIQDYLDQYVN